MNTALKQRRVVDTILTKVVMGYDLDQEFTAHHLFPDVEVNEMAGKIIKFGKDAFMIRNTKRAPGETVRTIGFNYSSDSYALENRLLEGEAPEEFKEAMSKGPGLSDKVEAVNIVTQAMRLEGEQDKVLLATNAANYGSTHVAALSGTDTWNDGASNPLAVIKDAKLTIRKATGRYPNVLHLDLYAYEALKIHPKIKENFKYSGAASITTDMLATYFDIEKVVVAKSVYVPTLESEFTELWGNNTVLAYVAPKGQRSMRRPSYGYNYMEKGYPFVEKGYFNQSNRSHHYPVHMRDQAILTGASSGFLIRNTAPIA